MKTNDVQAALAKLGWPLTVDGSYGPRTQEAVADFQRGWSVADLLVDGHAGPQTWQALTLAGGRPDTAGHGFTFAEFKSHGDGWIKLNRVLVRALAVYVARYGPAAHHTVSGYRDPIHNRKIGGASNSQHLYGNASDVDELATLAGVRGLGVFSGIGVQRSTGKVRHLDVRHDGPNTTGSTVTQPAVWYYGDQPQ